MMRPPGRPKAAPPQKDRPGACSFSAVPGSGRPLGLFVIRESDENDMDLFNGLRESTYIRHRSTRAVEEVRRVGLRPMEAGASGFHVTTRSEDGRKVRHLVPVEVITEGKTTAYLFGWQGYWHLWSQASAAKLGRGRPTNEFTTILKNVIERLRPRGVLAGNFSRLIRSQWQGNHLLTGMQGNVDIVIAGDTSFPLVGERAHEGLMMFSMFSMVTSMERNWIVQRMLTGRITQCRRGEWPLGARAVPFGYRIDKTSKALVADETKVAEVQKMIAALLSGAPPKEMARRLSETGMRTTRRINGRWQKVPPKDMDSFAHLITSLWAWAPLYVTGQYLLRYTNAFPGIEELAGAPVSYHHNATDDDNTDAGEGASERDSSAESIVSSTWFDDEFANDLDVLLRGLPDLENEHLRDPGELQLLLAPGVPDGGWAEPDVLAEFSRQAAHRSMTISKQLGIVLRPLAPSVAADANDPDLLSVIAPARMIGRSANYYRDNSATSKAEVAPFSGRGWVDGAWYYELGVSARATYNLVRHPLATMAAIARELERDATLGQYLADSADPYDAFGDIDIADALDPIDYEPIL